jgi:cytochrome c oxidase subunit I+III
VSSDRTFDPGVYDRFPTKPRPQSEVDELEKIWAAPGGWASVTIINNNYVGLWYIGTAFLFFLLAGVLALMMRTQLALPLQGFVSEEVYNQLFTMHGTVMMFLFAVPMMEALAVLLLPQMFAARDLPFPRLSAYAFWAYFVGGIAFFLSIFVGLAPDGGWFMYPPLTGPVYSPSIQADFWLLGIGFIEISAIAGAIEIIVGVLRTRPPGMTLDKMPIFAWGMLVFAGMVVIAFPAVILCTALLELERAFNWPFFDAARGGDPLLWQHLFWFFGHPEVYIIFLPAASLVSTMIPALARSRLVGHDLVILAFVATAFISFGVWTHHMFATGLPLLSLGFFSAASMAVSVPAGIQVFAWIATFASGKPEFNTPTLFVIGGLVTFVIGGLTGVMVAMVPFDWQAHDTYFIVAHLHYVLLGGAVLPMFAAFYYWIPMTSSRPLSERLGKWVFWLIFCGVQITFFPMHLTGFMGMPRRVFTYLPEWGLEVTNFISTVGAFTIGAGVLLFLFDLARNFRIAVQGNAGNVYGGGTLEWLPTGLYSARSIPIVTSRQPLWDQPNISKEVEDGRYFLPNAPTGRRETMITSPLRAEPEYIEIMPGPSPWPFFAAVTTAGFFLLLTIKADVIAFVSGIGAILCVVLWLWESDRPVAPAEVDVGAGVMLPTYATGRRTHGWWAMVILLIVIAMIWLMTLFGYVYVFGTHHDFWRPGPGFGSLVAPVLLYAMAAGLALFARRLLCKGTTLWTPPTLLLLGAGFVVAAAIVDFLDWRALGFDPELSSQAALVHTFAAEQGLLSAICAIMALYIAGRNSRGLVTTPRNNSFDLVTLFTVYTAAQGIATALVTRAVAAAA